MHTDQTNPTTLMVAAPGQTQWAYAVTEILSMDDMDCREDSIVKIRFYDHETGEHLRTSVEPSWLTVVPGSPPALKPPRRNSLGQLTVILDLKGQCWECRNPLIAHDPECPVGLGAEIRDEPTVGRVLVFTVGMNRGLEVAQIDDGEAWSMILLDEDGEGTEGQFVHDQTWESVVETVRLMRVQSRRGVVPRLHP